MKTNFALIALCCLIPQFAPAVIVAGAKGGGNNSLNTTQAELDTLVGDGHFFNNVFLIGGGIPGSGVYIGYKNTPGGKVGYALSGMHLSYTGNLTIQSTTYTFQSRTSIDGSDLALYSFTHPLDQMPNLQALTLSSITPTIGTSIVMIGGGRNRVQNAATTANDNDSVAVAQGSGFGYTATSDRLLRWGTNLTAAFPGPSPTNTLNIGSRPTILTASVFTQPANGQWLNSTEAQGVAGDSGGGVFGLDGALLGIMAAVSGPSNTTAAFGDATFFADIASYKDTIDSAIGAVLVPELPSWALAGLSLSLFAAVQRRFRRSEK